MGVTRITRCAAMACRRDPDRPTNRPDGTDLPSRGFRLPRRLPFPCVFRGQDDHLSLESKEIQTKGWHAAQLGKSGRDREGDRNPLRVADACDRDRASSSLPSRQRDLPAFLLDLFDAQCQAEYRCRDHGASDGRDAGGAYGKDSAQNFSTCHDELRPPSTCSLIPPPAQSFHKIAIRNRTRPLTLPRGA